MLRWALLPALQDDDDGVRLAVVQAFGKLGPRASQALPELIEIVTSECPAPLDGERTTCVEVQSEAALALGQIGGGAAARSEEHTRIVPTLVDALEDPEPEVRYRAAQALGLLAGQAGPAVPKLEGLLADDDIALRYQAARALQAIDPAPRLGHVEEVNRDAEQEVAELLVAIKDDDVRRQRDASRTLSNIGPAGVAAIPDLVNALTLAQPASRRDLASSIRRIGQEATFEASGLIGDLQHGNPEVRMGAARILGRLGANANSIKATLVGALERPDLPFEVRFTVAEALGDIGAYTTQTARSLAEAAVNDDNAMVRREATTSLEQQAAEGS